MANSALSDILVQGGWNSAYSSHFAFAHESYKLYEKLLEELEDAENDARSSIDEMGELLEDLTSHQTNHLHAPIYREAQSTLLYSCMAIEGFLNFYGTVRIGEKMYKRIMERTGITEKLTLLTLLCFEETLNAKDDLLKNIRKLFDQRNALVHPKAREITFENMKMFHYIHPRDINVHEGIETIELFTKFFIEKDPSVSFMFGISRSDDSELIGKHT